VSSEPVNGNRCEQLMRGGVKNQPRDHHAKADMSLPHSGVNP